MTRTPYEEFIDIARLLNKAFDITPVLYGSLGLEISSGISFDPQDIDILVPGVYLHEKWDGFRAEIERTGYTLNDLHEHEFVRERAKIAFAEEEGLLDFARVDANRLATMSAEGVLYRILTLEDYLVVYEKCLTDGYRRAKNNGKDIEKIEKIKALLTLRDL